MMEYTYYIVYEVYTDTGSLQYKGYVVLSTLRKLNDGKSIADLYEDLAKQKETTADRIIVLSFQLLKEV
jgi:hypothetical protein